MEVIEKKQGLAGLSTFRERPSKFELWERVRVNKTGEEGTAVLIFDFSTDVVWKVRVVLDDDSVHTYYEDELTSLETIVVTHEDRSRLTRIERGGKAVQGRVDRLKDFFRYPR